MGSEKLAAITHLFQVVKQHEQINLYDSSLYVDILYPFFSKTLKDYCEDDANMEKLRNDFTGYLLASVSSSEIEEMSQEYNKQMLQDKETCDAQLSQVLQHMYQLRSDILEHIHTS
jgi:hypothetical protein